MPDVSLSPDGVCIKDDGALHNYRTEIPNTIIRGHKSKGLSIYAKWLYVYLKSVAGDSGVCYQSMTTLTEQSGMSRGQVHAAKHELSRHGLITITHGNNPRRHSDRIRIRDIWPVNMQEFSVHTVNTDEEKDLSQCSYSEQGVHTVNGRRSLEEDLKEKPKTKEGEGSAPAPEIVKGFFMPQEFIPTPLLIEHMTRDCPHVDVPHAIKKCMVTTFRRSILDPALTMQKFCLEEEERARDLLRRYPSRAPLVHERVSQGTSDNIRTYERLRARKFTSQPEENAYGTDRGRLLSRHAGSDHPGRPVSRFSVRNTDGQLLGDPTTRAVSG